MIVLRFLVVAFSLIKIGQAAESAGSYLEVPEQTQETLQPVGGDEFRKLRSEYALRIPGDAKAVIYWMSGWGVTGVAVVYTDSTGAYRIAAERPDQNTAGDELSSIELPAELAKRIVRLIQYELRRGAKAFPDNRIYLDVGTYYFTATGDEPLTSGQTHGLGNKTTLGRLCRVIDGLSGLPTTLDGGDRVRALNEIYRGVTAIEVAYGLIK